MGARCIYGLDGWSGWMGTEKLVWSDRGSANFGFGKLSHERVNSYDNISLLFPSQKS